MPFDERDKGVADRVAMLGMGESRAAESLRMSASDEDTMDEMGQRMERMAGTDDHDEGELIDLGSGGEEPEDEPFRIM